eukprot:COSAG06_NODE_5768_length_3282_cov_3.482878_2_plen_711_part_00
MPTEQARPQQPRSKEEEEEGVPFDEGHQRQLFEALDSAPDASLDYLHDLARSAGIGRFFGWQNSWYLTLLSGFSIQKGLSRHYFYLHGPSLALWPARAPRAGLSKVEWEKHSLKVEGLQYDNDLSGIITLCDALPGLQKLISLDLSNCGLSVKGAIEIAKAVSPSAALTRTCLLNNPLGEGVNEIIKVFEETPRLHTLCGFEEGVQQIDWEDSGKGPADVALLSAELKAGRAVAAVESIDLSECGLTGATYDPDAELWDKIDSNIDGFIALCVLLGKVRTVRLANCGLGPRSTAELAKVFHDADVALNSLTLDSNGIFGKLPHVFGFAAEPDKFAGDCDAFLAALKESKIVTLSLSLQRTGIGPLTLPKLATSLPTGIARVDLRSNGLNDDALAELRELADFTAGQVFVWAREGKIDLSSASLTLDDITSLTTFLATPAGATLKAITLDGQPISGSTPRYHDWQNGVDKTDADMSGFNLLCEALASSQIEVVSMKSCYLGPQALASLTEAIKVMAAMTNICLLNNPLGEGVDEIIKVFEETPRLRTLCGFEEAVEKVDWKDSGKGPADVALLSAELKAGRAVAVLTSLQCGSNPLVRKNKQGGEYAPDAKTFGELCHSLKASQVTDLDFSNCGLGPISVNHLSDLVRDTTATLTEIDVRQNLDIDLDIDEASLAALRAAAEETGCTILADDDSSTYASEEAGGGQQCAQQ